MGEVKTIKDVDDATWSSFKSLAAKHKLKMGTFFSTIVSTYEKSAKDAWNGILEKKAILTPQEAEELEKTIRAVRKEYGFRT